jgi:hypothetical protein
MTTPVGLLQSITTALKRLASNGHVEGLRAYVHGDAFLRAFNGLDPRRRATAMRCYAKAEALCEAKAPRPLVKPGPIDARRARKANWSDPAMRAKLADAYAVAGGDDEKAARILGVSLGSARLARKRHLDPAAIGCRQNAPSGPRAAIYFSVPGVWAALKRPASRVAHRLSEPFEGDRWLR